MELDWHLVLELTCTLCVAIVFHISFFQFLALVPDNDPKHSYNLCKKYLKNKRKPIGELVVLMGFSYPIEQYFEESQVCSHKPGCVIGCSSLMLE